ncbi:ATP synthase F0 subunit C [bacterium]|nr:ATP synthase F0 subunit C [bacterium]
MVDESWMKTASLLGAALSMGIGAVGPAYGLGYASSKACEGVMRQPYERNRITKIMLIGQAVTESPAIFSLLISILLLFGSIDNPSIVGMMALVGSGLCMGAGALGPGVGAGFANAAACEGVARMPEYETLILRTMLIGQAVSQSTSIYALVIAFLLKIV